MAESIRKGQSISQFVVKDLLPEGSGGMAIVVQATRNDGAEVALKVCRSVSDPFFSNALKAEAEILQKMDHPGVVKILPIHSDIGRKLYMERATEITGHPWYFVMEYLGGGSLRDYLKKISALTPGEAAFIGREVALALGHIHSKGYAHNDIKTDNIMFRHSVVMNSSYEPVLIDFGIAAKLKRIQQDVGSILWMSPERLDESRGAIAPEIIDAAKVDIYAMGVLLYKMLTTKMPFSGVNEKSITTAIRQKIPEHVSVINQKVPKGFDELIIACMEKRPEARPPISQLTKELAYYSTNEITTIPKTRSWFGRKNI
jgi:serine/threonine-protein kinase